MHACGYQWCRLCGKGDYDFDAALHYSRGGCRGRWNLNQEDELRDIPIDAPLAPVTPDNLAVVVADRNVAVPRLFPLDVDRDSERDRVIDECPHYWQKQTGVDRRRWICELCRSHLPRLWACTTRCETRLCMRCRDQNQWASR